MRPKVSNRPYVLQIQTQAEAAGAQRVSDLVAEGLRADGYDVRTAFMYRKTAAYDADPFALFVSRDVPATFFQRLMVAAKLVRLVRSEAPQAVITYQHYGNIVGGIAARLASARVVIANQSGNPGRHGAGRIVTWGDRLGGILGLYDHIVVNSASTENAYRSYPAGYASRLIRIDHGVRRIEVSRESRDVRRQFDLPQDARLLATTGRLAPGKNHDVLIRALRHIPDIHLVIAGRGPDLLSLEKLAVTLMVSDRVHFVGELAVEDVSALLKAADIFVFASTEETFGMSVVEAAVAGLPVVTTDLPVLREVLTNADGLPSALFFPPADDAALARALTTILQDEGLASRLRSAGLSLRERYAPERMAAGYGELIRRALGPAQ